MTTTLEKMLYLSAAASLVALGACKKAEPPKQPATTPPAATAPAQKTAPTSQPTALPPVGAAPAPMENAKVAANAVPGALADLAIGQSAPDFALKDEDGKEHRLSQYKGKVVVLEWTSPKCPFVKRHYQPNEMPKTAKSVDRNEVVWLAVDSSHFNTAAASAAWRKEKGFDYPTLQDPDGKLGRIYGARTTPHMFVIDKDGVLRYQGAIDDDPKGRAPTRTNFVLGAIEAIKSGKAPSPTTTKPYGCTVKYRG